MEDGGSSSGNGSMGMTAGQTVHLFFVIFGVAREVYCWYKNSDTPGVLGSNPQTDNHVIHVVKHAVGIYVEMRQRIVVKIPPPIFNF